VRNAEIVARDSEKIVVEMSMMIERKLLIMKRRRHFPHRYRMGVLLTILMLLLAACAKQSAQDDSSQHPVSSSSRQAVVSSSTPALSEPSAEVRFQEIYQHALPVSPENVRVLEWLSDTQLYWITENREAEDTTYALHVADVRTGEETLVYERSVENSHSLDMSVELSENQMELYVHDYTVDVQAYSKIIFSTVDWEIIHEEAINLPVNIFPYIPWEQKSKLDIVVGEETMTDGSRRVVLWPLETPEQLYPLGQFTNTQYAFISSTWSPSGEYFLLQNRDALGFDAIESLIGYPKDQWPKARQYDVFAKDGSFAFSFPVDFLHREDGSESTYDLFWIPGDQLFISSTFYDAALDTKQSKDQILDSTGKLQYEKTYEGDRNYYYRGNYFKDSVFYTQVKEDTIHLIELSFLTGEVIDYGAIATTTNEDWRWVSIIVSADKSSVLLYDKLVMTIRVLELIA
jgi:hypothetical protein